MKLFSPNRQQGSTLAVTLVMGITIGTVLGAYLSLVSNRYEITMRSQCWNTAVPVLEAGIEEALTHLHNDVGNPSANGWTNGVIGGQTVYGKQRTFSDGSAFYTVIYNATSLNPYIYSTGLIPAPRHRDTYISRTVKVNGVSQPLFNVAFAAIYKVDLNGKGGVTDSFNSGLPSLNTNYRYDSKKTSTNGNVASVYGPVDFGNHTINGSLYLGPAVTTYPKDGVSGQTYTDFNVSYPDVILPTPTTGTWQNAVKTPVNKTQVYDFTSTGYYVVSDRTTPIIVEPGANVTLQVTGNYAPDSIHVKATNGISGSLAIYQVSGDGSLNDVVLDIPRARYFYYYGLPGVTSITYNGSDPNLIAAIYAPEAVLNLNGGSKETDISGSCIVKSVKLNGNGWAFHLDEDLLTSGPSKGLVITSWQEL
jgi:hypothetical protein